MEKKIKVCGSCNIILTDSVAVKNRYSTKCKYCYNRQKREEYKFWYENKCTKPRFKYEIECTICGSIKQVQHPKTKVCGDECKTKYKAFKDKVRRMK